MPSAVRRFGAAVCLVVGAVITAQAAAAVSPAAPVGNVEPVLDPANGKVAVVAASAPVDGKVAVIVQNGTTAPVQQHPRHRGGNVVPTAAAPRRSARGRSCRRRSHPMRSRSACSDFVHATSRRAPRSRTGCRAGARGPATIRTALEVGSLVLSPPLAGDVAQTLDVTVMNPSSRTIRGPLEVRVTCFGESARPSLAVDTPDQEVEARVRSEHERHA